MNEQRNNVLVEGLSFPNTWAHLVQTCMDRGIEIPASQTSIKPVMTRDILATTIMYSDAIRQIEAIQLHPQFPTKKAHVLEYIKEFTYEFANAQRQLPEGDLRKFVYIYFELLISRSSWVLTNIPKWATLKNLLPIKKYHTKPQTFTKTKFDQLKILAENLRALGINRRIQAVTWDPLIHAYDPEPPCMQRIWIRPLSTTPNHTGKIPVEVHITWRSRDLFSAWMSNLIGIVTMLNQYVMKDEYRIVKLVDICDSLHIYEGDWDAASNVIPVNEYHRGN